jgi:orotate phosphoribosyltransferase
VNKMTLAEINEGKRRMIESGALLDGHFLLSSGMHSRSYLQCALFLRFPENAAWAGSLLAGMVAPLAPSFIVSPAVGGLIIGHEVARHLNIPFIFCEREKGDMKLRRFPNPGPLPYVIVEDVVTTGKSTNEVRDAMQQVAGGAFLGAACIVDRSSGSSTIGPGLFSLMQFDFPVYSEEECPICKEGVALVEPGSRRITG